METQAQHVSPKKEFSIPVVELSFDPELMFQKGARQTLSKELTGVYNGLKEDKGNPGCVVVIKASTAGSPLIRALLELYKTVTANRGQLRRVDYPREFRDSLSTLGFRSLPGFAHSATTNEAVGDLGGTVPE